MLRRHEVHATVMYGSDSWDEYWEGTLRRSNGNIGTVTTRSVAAHLGVRRDRAPDGDRVRCRTCGRKRARACSTA